MTRWYIFDRQDTTLPETAARLLPPWRRERFERLRPESSRQESLAAGLLYAYAMRAEGVEPDAPVRFLPAGKPVLRERDDVNFSLSHSGRYVLCAVSGGSVGADVQQVRTLRASVARSFHPAEQAWLDTLGDDERQAGFFRLWTRKEAWVKAVSAERMLSLAEEDVTRSLSGLYFRECSLPGGYAAAICAEEPVTEDPIPVTRQELLRPNRR